jgi:UDP-N-acetylmuramoyl-tripeptide--D-alanyl-D-alanine ligase
MKLRPEELKHISHIEFLNVEKLRGKEIFGVSTDSRSVREGELFVALRGESFDGHKFLTEAFEKGCAAAIVDPAAKLDAVKTLPLLIVRDTTRALGELAKYYRQKFSIPVIAIGGSNGKTTTKEMVAAVLSQTYSVLSTQGNLNNHIGVPQTLFKLEKRHQAAVIEIGTNHPGELKYLCDILEPTHGLLTNIGREHLEFFKNLSGVAKEEGTLFDKLHKHKGAVAFVNVDDKRVAAKAKKLKAVVSYSFATKKASVVGRMSSTNEAGCAKFSFSAKSAKRAATVQLKIPGAHNAYNALSAAAIGLTLKVPTTKIQSALEKFSPAKKRMEILNINGIVLFNDTYNANPDSMIAALHTLVSAAVTGKRIAVLADMKELGDASFDEHARIGKEASKLSIDYLFTYGEHAKKTYEAATLKNKLHYDQKNVLAEYVAELLSPGDAVLVKGSRGMTMEDVVAFLQERLTAKHAHG